MGFGPFFAFSKRLKAILHILMKLFLLSSFPPAPLGSSVLVQRDLVPADFFTPGATQGQITPRERMGSLCIPIITKGFLRWKNSLRFPRLPSPTTKLACGQMYNQHISICLGCEPSSASIVFFGKPVNCFVLPLASLHSDCLLCRTLYA